MDEISRDNDDGDHTSTQVLMQQCDEILKSMSGRDSKKFLESNQELLNRYATLIQGITITIIIVNTINQYMFNCRN